MAEDPRDRLDAALNDRSLEELRAELRASIDELIASDGPEDAIQELEREYQRLGAVTDSANAAREELAAIDAEFETRLQAAKDRARRSHEDRTNIARTREKELASQGKASRGLGVGLTLAYMILGTPMAGFGIGWLIDRANGVQNQASSVGILLGSILGLGLAVVIMNRDNDRT